MLLRVVGVQGGLGRRGEVGIDWMEGWAVLQLLADTKISVIRERMLPMRTAGLLEDMPNVAQFERLVQLRVNGSRVRRRVVCPGRSI